MKMRRYCCDKCESIVHVKSLPKGARCRVCGGEMKELDK